MLLLDAVTKRTFLIIKIRLHDVIAMSFSYLIDNGIKLNS